MANISLTRQCTRGCDYCFAMHERHRSAPLHMSHDVYERALRFLERSKIADARLLGGEPTEHPEFSEYVSLAIDRGFKVTIFTGGIVGESALRCMRDIPVGSIIVVLNAAVPDSDTEDLVTAQQGLCRTLGEKVEIGITLDSRGRQPDFVLDWIQRYGLRRRARLGLAHPILGASNRSLRLQSLPILRGVLEGFVRHAETLGIEIGLDCGFTPCMFSTEFMQERPAFSKSIGPRCNSIIDILPEGDVIACYALSRLRRIALTDECTRSQLLSAFDRDIEPLIPDGMGRDCITCDYRTSGRCTGGCRARRALRLRPDALQILTNNRSNRSRGIQKDSIGRCKR